MKTITINKVFIVNYDVDDEDSVLLVNGMILGLIHGNKDYALHVHPKINPTGARYSDSEDYTYCFKVGTSELGAYFLRALLDTASSKLKCVKFKYNIEEINGQPDRKS